MRTAVCWWRQAIAGTVWPSPCVWANCWQRCWQDMANCRRGVTGRGGGRDRQEHLTPTISRREGAPLNWRPSADAVAGNGGTLSCAPSADAVAGNGAPLNWRPSAVTDAEE